jgi:hypothetical protein
MLNRGLMLGDETLIDLTTSNEWVGDPIVWDEDFDFL